MRTRLDSGLNVILRSAKASPVAALQLWVNVGGADELPHEAGLAHLHEHMLFKGTKRRGPGEIARSVEGAGGDINAWTSHDQTVYHLVLPVEFLEEGLDVLADAVTESAFDAGELAREIEVVCEEIRRGEDSPSRQHSKALFAEAFARHPYRNQVIGTAASVRSFTREAILDFYGRHYTAPNMTFIGVGAFDEDRAIEAVSRAFSNVRRGPAGHRAERTIEPGQDALRVRIDGGPVKETHVTLAWHIPGLDHDDTAALDLLASLLGQGDASRLQVEVKRERGLVNAAYASAWTPKDTGLFTVGATLIGDGLAPALAELLRQTYRTRREEFDGADLARAKRNVESEVIWQGETVQGQARRLGFFAHSAEGPESEERYLSAIAAATPETLRIVAEKYLQSRNMTLSVLAPAELVGKGAFVEATLRDLVAQADAGLGEKITKTDSTPYHRLTAPPKVRHRGETPAIIRETLPGGVTLLVREEHASPLVAIRAAWLGGLRAESTGNNGVSALLARTIARGTATLSAFEVAKLVDSMSGSLSGSAGRNSFGLRGEFLSADFARAFELFSDVLFTPALTDAEVERDRKLLLEDLATREDNPASVAFSMFWHTLFDTHPYRLEAAGTPASVGALDAAALRSFHIARHRPNGLVLAVVGDVRADRVKELAAKYLSSVDQSLFPQVRVAREKPIEAPREISKRLDKKQAHMVVGFRGATVDSADRPALEVLSSILSGQGGRLFLELRDKRSLAYSVSSMHIEGMDPGAFAVYIATGPEKTAEARDGIRRELERIRTEPVSADELRRAARHISGSHDIGLQRLGSRAAVMALEEQYGLGAEAHLKYPQTIRAVTADDVLRVARTYLDPRGEVTAIVSPLSEG